MEKKNFDEHIWHKTPSARFYSPINRNQENFWSQKEPSRDDNYSPPPQKVVFEENNKKYFQNLISNIQEKNLAKKLNTIQKLKID